MKETIYPIAWEQVLQSWKEDVREARERRRESGSAPRGFAARSRVFSRIARRACPQATYSMKLCVVMWQEVGIALCLFNRLYYVIWDFSHSLHKKVPIWKRCQDVRILVSSPRGTCQLQILVSRYSGKKIQCFSHNGFA